MNLADDYNQIKDRIGCRLINAKANQAYLEDKPYTQVEDLAAIYHILVDEVGGAVYGLTINKELAERFGISTEALHTQALSNMEKEQSYEIKTLGEVMTEIMLGGSIDMNDLDMDDMAIVTDLMMPEPEMPFYVLTNQERHYGSSVILSDEIRQEIASWMGDFYILPSSVHETILIPKEMCSDYRELNQMVHDVNESAVEAEDWLSDHVYEYDSKSHELSRCDWKEARERGKTEKRSLKEKLAEGKAVSTKLLSEKMESPDKKKEELMH